MQDLQRLILEIFFLPFFLLGHLSQTTGTKAVEAVTGSQEPINLTGVHSLFLMNQTGKKKL